MLPLPVIIDNVRVASLSTFAALSISIVRFSHQFDALLTMFSGNFCQESTVSRSCMQLAIAAGLHSYLRIQ